MPWAKLGESISSFREASPFWQGIRQIFSWVREFFIARSGDGLQFQYWLDALLQQGILREAFRVDLCLHGTLIPQLENVGMERGT